MQNKNIKKSVINRNVKILEVKNLKTHFKVGTGKQKITVRAVDDISFDIYEKEVFGIVGESGSGKTTASRTIIRLYNPTGGTVVFENQIIGSGADEHYKAIRDEKNRYKFEKLKLNERKYDINNLKLKYQENFHLIDQKELKLKQQFEERKAEINSKIESYKRELFIENTAYKLELENALFEYTSEKDAAFNQTRNEYASDYKDIKKNMERSLKNKIESLTHSAGLDDESREIQKKELVREHNKDLELLEVEYTEKILQKENELVPVEEYKKQAAEFKVKYNERVDLAKKKHEEFLANIEKPNIVTAKKLIVEARIKYIKDLAALKSERREIQRKLNDEIKKIPEGQKPDVEKLKELNVQHKAFIAEQRALIKQSKADNRTKEAIEKTKRMQMIFQDPISSLNPRMTVGEIVSEGLVINGEKDKKVIQDKVIEMLRLVGLAPEYISRYPHEFSGGQRQRIGIARALIMNPSFIIADEPISALDVSIRAQVLNLLNDLKNQLDLSILFIAHDLSVVKFFCDRIAVMYAGKIVEMADNEELFSNPIHPYTQALLSAIPQPDPDTEKLRKRTIYNPGMHDYSTDLPELKEIRPGHFVYCNNAEFEKIMSQSKGDVNA